MLEDSIQSHEPDNPIISHPKRQRTDQQGVSSLSLNSLTTTLHQTTFPYNIHHEGISTGVSVLTTETNTNNNIAFLAIQENFYSLTSTPFNPVWLGECLFMNNIISSEQKMDAANESIESDLRNYKLFAITLTAIQTNEHVYTSLLNILSVGRVYQHLIEKIKTSYEKLRRATPQSLQRKRHQVTGMSVLIVACVLYNIYVYIICVNILNAWMYMTQGKNIFLSSHDTDSKQH